MNLSLKTAKAGDRVAVLYDCKYTRAVEGKVVRKYKGMIEVQFVPWANEEAGLVSAGFINRRGRLVGYLVGKGENRIMRSLGCPGDYYEICSYDEVIEEGYTIEPMDRRGQQ